MTLRCGVHSYSVDDVTFEGFLADGSNGAPAPGILVVHEGRGYTQHPRDRAMMLAEQGYVAFAPDYLGGAADNLDNAFAMMERFNRERDLFRRHGSAALDVLRAQPGVDPQRLAAIGFCWGGYAVIELACHEPLSCVVGFHPGLSLGPFTNPSAITGSVLVCVGNRDPYVPMADIQGLIDTMDDAGVDCQVLLLAGAPHSFSNPEPYAYETGQPNVGYDERADRRSWKAMLSLFAERL